MNTTAAPALALPVRAFNVPVGAVIRHSSLTIARPDGEGEWVVTDVARDSDREQVALTVVFHGMWMPVDERVYEARVLGFCAEVEVLGFCVNPEETDDLDYGVA